MENSIPQQWNKFILKDVSFVNLMTRRIYNVLIIANPYDAFMLEDDGRVDEKIFNEYTELGLRYPPSFTQVSTIEEAAEALRATKFDLVICMPGNADNDAFDVARDVKKHSPEIPCVVLTPFSRYYPPCGERGYEYLRLRVLLAWQYQPDTLHHQADRRPHESGA